MMEPDVLADIRSARDEMARRYGDAWALSQALAERSRAGGQWSGSRLDRRSRREP